jgi:phospholipase A2
LYFPGVQRESSEEFNFAEFDIFDDPKAPFSTFNFTYEHENFDKLSQLMEFNTLLHIDEIKQVCNVCSVW